MTRAALCSLSTRNSSYFVDMSGTYVSRLPGAPTTKCSRDIMGPGVHTPSLHFRLVPWRLLTLLSSVKSCYSERATKSTLRCSLIIVVTQIQPGHLHINASDTIHC